MVLSPIPHDSARRKQQTSACRCACHGKHREKKRFSPLIVPGYIVQIYAGEIHRHSSEWEWNPIATLILLPSWKAILVRAGSNFDLRQSESLHVVARLQRPARMARMAHCNIAIVAEKSTRESSHCLLQC
eukprot:scaffold1169_cov120-Cylindrotheca_fusiformis.AAC.24